MLFKANTATADATTEKTQKKEERVYHCAACEIPISKEKYLCCVGLDSPFHSFVNPAGFYFDVITFSECHSLIDVPGATFQHTWFPGYAWQIVGCAKCRQHLGWRFESAKKMPRRFYGLIKNRLTL